MNESTPHVVDLANIQRGLRLGRFIFVDDELEKLCIHCKEYWPCDLEFYYAAPRNPDGLNNVCKACYIERRHPNGRPSQSTPNQGTAP